MSYLYINKFLILLFFIGLPTKSLAKEPVLVAIVDMGISYRFSPLESYMNKKDHQKGWDFSQNEKSYGIDYQLKYEGQPHGTVIANIIARPQYKNSNRIKLLDVVYTDYFGNLFNINKFPFPQNGYQVYQKKQAYLDFNKHLKETFLYAENMGARVVNFSSSHNGFKSEILKEYFETASSRNVFFVVSAGNESKDLNQSPSYPCSYNIENVICVGSVDKNNQITNFSNYGKSVNVFTLGDFGDYHGTSFSAPIISRALSLIIYHNPKWKNEYVKKELFSFVEINNNYPVFNIKKFHQKYK